MSIIDDVKNKLFGEDIEALLKADADNVPDTPEPVDSKKDIGRQAILDDPYFNNYGNAYLYKQRASRLSNRMLKDISIRDWVVSTIIQHRVDVIQRFARPQKDRFDMGFKILKKDGDSTYTKAELEEIKNLENFVYHCGRTENVPEDDKMLFNKFLKMTFRDALTFGHISIEKVKTKGGGLHRFRPLPAESVYLIDEKADKNMLTKHIESYAGEKANPRSNNDPKKDQTVNRINNKFKKYVQMSMDDRPLASFGTEDMIFKLFNPQNFMDSKGYCYSPIELAVVNITNHMNVESYNANFFTHGYAARGLLHLKGTVTQSQLTTFRRQFYNTISGTQHAWRTPIIAGLDDVDWIPISGSAREMEYIDFNNHLMRSLCSQFQIDPAELGLDYLGSANGNAPSGQDSNKNKIEFSRERGLYPALMFFEDFMNSDLLPSVDKELADKYMFKFVGYTDETPQTEVALLQAEMTVHASMNDLMKHAQKTEIKDIAADLPMNDGFWALIEKNYTRGEIREKFFNDKGATERPELQYIPGDPAFMGWQQMLLTIDRQKKQDDQMAQQAQAEQEQAEHEKGMDDKQHDRDQEAHEAEMEDRDHEKAHAAVEAGNSLKDTAKEVGATSTPLMIDGKPTANPINVLDDDEE